MSKANTKITHNKPPQSDRVVKTTVYRPGQKPQTTKPERKGS